MKKLFFLLAFSLFSVSTAFAVTSNTDGVLTVTGQDADATNNIPATKDFVFNVSKGVTMEYVGHATGKSYAVTSSHSSGNVTYGSSSVDTAIYKNETGIAQTTPDAPVADTTTGEFTSSFASATGWVKM